MAAKPLAEVKNLSVRFGDIVAIEGIEFSIYPGEVVAVIGLNGAGKTTLLKTMLGVYKPTTGAIAINTRRVGYVPQLLNFDRTIPLTVRELLQTYNSSSQIEQKLALTGGRHLLNKKVGDLSGGELQRVLLANALLAEPELLLLDEPTTGIDVVGEQTFFGIVKDLQDKCNMGIILVSHDIHMVYRHATRIVCINRTMMCSGTPHEVAANANLAELFGGYLTLYKHEHDS